MSPAAEILVIILSVFLAIFLLLGIILFIYLIRLSAEIKKITESTKRTVGNIENVVSGFAKVTSPFFIAEYVSRIINKFVKKSKKEE